MTITKDYTRDALFDTLGLLRLKQSYMRTSESSPQDRFAYVSGKFSSNPEHAQRLYDYVSRHWLSYSTPILSYDENKKGMAIACFLNSIQDTAEGLVENLSETNRFSMLGGGVGINFGMRSAGDKSTGVLPHLKIYDASSLAFKQGRTRRGSYAAYLDISHPDIKMFLELRKPTGDQNLRALNMHHGINIPDAFMELVDKCTKDETANDSWELKDPNSDEVREVVSAKELWQSIIETRMQTGEPYLHFIDESNRKLPQWLKDKGLRINQSNLCSEIILPTNQDRTAVCCLSSVNLEYFDEWKNDPLFLHDVAEMLDNVLQHFIDNAPDTVHRAIHSAKQERSIGVGALGFHAYLQKNNIPWESAQAVGKNLAMFRHIQEKLEIASIQLGKERGEAPDALGTGYRFSHKTSVAPNASSSIIMGNTSPSIEPYRANAYRQDTLSGSHLTKNKFLDRLLTSKGLNEEELADAWSSIIANDGSVRGLKCLTDWEKDVFKTAIELDQRWIIQHAADRQPYIDQAQSVNVFFRPDANIKYIHSVHMQAWKSRLKTMYYCRSEKIGKADKLHHKVERDIIKEIDKGEEECLACNG